jgi:hypothetical protein
MVDPKSMPNDWDGKPIRTPEAFAEWIVEMLWTRSLFLDEGVQFERDAARPNASRALEHGHYHLPRARKALELKTKAQERAEQRNLIEKIGQRQYVVEAVKRMEANRALEELRRNRKVTKSKS